MLSNAHIPSNAQIAAALEELTKLMELNGADGFRVNAHARAARAVEGSSVQVAALVHAGGKLTEIEGIGPKLAEKISEYVTTGRIEELSELKRTTPPGLLEIMSVPGLGPKTVKNMWDAGIVDIPGLKRAIEDGSVLNLPRMGEKAVAKIKEALVFAAQSGQRIHLGRAGAVADIFVERLSSLPGVVHVTPAGSLRRGKETIGDIDVLVCVNETGVDWSAIAAEFCATPGVVQVIAQGESKSSVRYALDGGSSRWQPEPTVAENGEPVAGPSIQVDLRILPASHFGSALMYFTGSKEHNVKLRERAIDMGYTLNEWGLYRVKPGSKETKPPQERGEKPVAAATEEDVYAALGLPWIPPEAREDRGELTQSQPWRLVEIADIKSELHAHTTASDGVLTIKELAQQAHARGFHTIAVTDHSQSSTIANGLKPDRLRLHIAAVRDTKVKGVTILAGSEVDILADGTLDYKDDLLRELDVVVASPHAALTQDSQAATARLLKAIAHPLVHIIGHPTGRLLLRRGGLTPDMTAIIEAAKEHDVALEINSHWMRLDLRDTHVRAAVEAGVKIAINCDDHEPSDFDNLRYGVATARRGWLVPELCINTWSSKELLAWLKRKR
jgi:DNA polymerase (family 10)